MTYVIWKIFNFLFWRTIFKGKFFECEWWKFRKQ